MAKIPQEILQNRIKQIVFEDYLTRFFAACIKRIVKPKRGSGKSGIVSIIKCSQQLLERTSARVREEGTEVRFFMGLPAAGRKILGKEAEVIFGREILQIVEKSHIFDNLPSREVFRHIYTVEDAQYIRDHLKESRACSLCGEWVVTGEDAVKIRAEDGRLVCKLLLSIICLLGRIQALFLPPCLWKHFPGSKHNGGS
ncbi:hypothetical protein H5U35_05185 [Candidatus Aerophobetes bacterium]|nr:hypothetical protein [Candidatus Aerophobetes bacterium]